MNQDIGVKELVKKAGGPTALGKLLGIRASAVSNWPHIPAKHMHRVSAITGIPAIEIRPDLVLSDFPTATPNKTKTQEATQ